GPVLLDDVVDVVARRLNLPLLWNVETINEEATALAAVDDDIPPACAEAAVAFLSQLTDNERSPPALRDRSQNQHRRTRSGHRQRQVDRCHRQEVARCQA
ncbi:MAG: hypothetical protein V9G12_08750, partial [Microthrixaceae bacterium]